MRELQRSHIDLVFERFVSLLFLFVATGGWMLVWLLGCHLFVPCSSISNYFKKAPAQSFRSQLHSSGFLLCFLLPFCVRVSSSFDTFGSSSSNFLLLFPTSFFLTFPLLSYLLLLLLLLGIIRLGEHARNEIVRDALYDLLIHLADNHDEVSVLSISCVLLFRFSSAKQTDSHARQTARHRQPQEDRQPDTDSQTQ